ncbi:MAG: iron-containing redox enzyme family protein [Polyangiaceae bacterium]
MTKTSLVQAPRGELANGSWNSLGRDVLTPLCAATGLESRLDEVIEAFALLTEGWGEEAIPANPAWESDVCSDHSPFEPSIALSPRGNVVRILVEAQGRAPTRAAQAEAGRALTQRIGKRWGLDTTRCEQLEALFLDTESPEGNPAAGRFGIWHALEFHPARPTPSVKVYFDLASWGPALHPALTEAALHQIGFAEAWPVLGELTTRRDRQQDQLAYFSIDVEDSPHARVKLYLRHHAASAEHLDGLFRSARSYRKESVKEATQALGVGAGPYLARPVVSSFAFTSKSRSEPVSATLYFPLESYVDTDALALSRVLEFNREFALPTTELEAAVRGLAPAPLDELHGLTSYVSFREEQDVARSTVYFSPLAFGRDNASERRLRAAKHRERVGELVQRFERHSLVHLPYFRRMSREPVSLERLWLLMKNFDVAIVQEFPRRLASLVARAPGDAIRALLAKQLHDELGGGDFTQAHKALFARLISGLEAHRADVQDPLIPARALSDALEFEYVSADPWFGVGASLLVEVFGKQVDTFVAAQFARQKQVAGHTLEWLDLHTVLEVDHADDSAEIAALIPEGEAEEAALAGAEHIANASNRFFAEMYRLTFD